MKNYGCCMTSTSRWQITYEKLVPVGEKLAFFVVYEWCIAEGAFELRGRAFPVIEDFYDVVPQCRGLRP